MSKIRDLTGQTFNKLTAIAHTGQSNPEGKAIWLWQCECGGQIELPGILVTRGNNTSCGCIRRNQLQGIMSIAKGVWRSHYSDGTLPFEEFWYLCQMNCYYCARPPSNTRARIYNPEVILVYSGLDRKVNELGHNTGNCIPCCWPCNKMKGTMSHDDFLLLIRQINKVTCNIVIDNCDYSNISMDSHTHKNIKEERN